MVGGHRDSRVSFGASPGKQVPPSVPHDISQAPKAMLTFADAQLQSAWPSEGRSSKAGPPGQAERGESIPCKFRKETPV